MIDLRPVVYVIGLVVAILGATMLVPMLVDLYYGSPDWLVFLSTATITMVVGGSMSLATANTGREGLTIQQIFLLTTLIWIALALFAALPLYLSEIQVRPVDAIFEAMSGLTTTGSTVLEGLDDLPKGLLVWRSMLQWFGGIGIIVVAMVFLPELRVGGMQIFRSEAFDTMGKVLPRAVDIAGRISAIYLVFTLLNMLAYMAVGLPPFEAINHALTTISTGGFSTHDASMGEYQGAPEYVAAVFMILGSLPFVRYIQMVQGTARPLVHRPAGAGLSRGDPARDPGDDTLQAGRQRRPFGTWLSRGRLQRHLDHIGHRLRQRRLPALGALSGRGFLFPRPDRRLRRLDRVLGQDLPLPAPVRRRARPDPRRSMRRTASSHRGTTAGR